MPPTVSPVCAPSPPAETTVAVIGGGINGAGAARDLARRGVPVALFERRDLCTGATGGCSGMIHGGPRYLLHDRRTTEHSSRDAGAIRRIASYMTFRIPFLIPVLPGDRMGRLALDAHEAFVAAYDRFQPLKGGLPHERLSAEEARRLEPGLNPALEGAVTMDEWGIDPFRLVVQNAVDAAEHGASIHTYTEVTGLLCEGRAVVGLCWRDRRDGREGATRARVVVNVAGPWAPRVCAWAGLEVRLRPGKGVHLILDRRLSNFAVTSTAVDGRQIFAIPHETATVIGTTDDDYYGDLDRIPVTEDEIEYLLAGMARVLPGIRRHRIARVMAAVRPTLWRHGIPEDDLSRNHRIDDHEADGAPGLITMTGGKLASYRLMCEELCNLVAARVGVRAPCVTAETPLPGGEAPADPSASLRAGPAALAAEFDVPEAAAARLVFRHGTRARRVLELVRERPAWGGLLCPCDPTLEAEVRYALRHEFVRDVTDLRRRCAVGTGPCQGMECAYRAAAVFAEERAAAGSAAVARASRPCAAGETPAPRSKALTGALPTAALGVEIARATRTFLSNRHRGALPAAAGPALAQAEFTHHVYFTAARLHEGCAGREPEA